MEQNKLSNDRLQRWALAAEIVGGLAVVISLAVVAFELNQSTNQAELNTNALEISAYQDLVAGISDLNSVVIEDPEFARIMGLAQAGSKELTQEEIRRFSTHSMNVFRHGDMAYFQYEKGAIDKERLDSALAIVFSRLTSSSIARERWETSKANFVNSYVNYIESSIKNWDDR
jgi:hypothetical protein